MRNESPVFSYQAAEAALCMWEDFDNATSDAMAELCPLRGPRAEIIEKMVAYRAANGSVAARAIMLDSCNWATNIWWKLAEELRYSVAFDWDFIPMVNDLIDWNPALEAPLKPSEDVAAEIITARLRAIEAARLTSR
jgi:hypothetical protein